MMLIFGAALISFFVLPWALAPETQFAWDVLAQAEGMDRLPPLLIIGSGVLAVLLSRLSLGVKARGLSALVAGFAPLALMALLLSNPPVLETLGAKGTTWQHGILLLGTSTLVTGLLLRSQYHSALVVRLLVSVGAACLLVPQLVPDTALVDAARSLADLPGKSKLVAICGLVPTALAVVGLLLTWLPTSGPVGTRSLAWLYILWPLIAALLLALVVSDKGLGDTIKGGLYQLFWSPLTSIAWVALAGYGLASFLGKSLEHN